MAKDYAKKFYASAAWHKCRAAYIAACNARDGGMCEVCHENPGYIVHHKRHLTPATIDKPEVTLSFSNLEYVCKDCHDRIHDFGRDEMEPAGSRTVIFDAEGNPLLLPP